MFNDFKQYILGVMTSLTVLVVGFYFFSDRPKEIPTVVVNYRFSQVFDYKNFISTSFVDGYLKIDSIFKKEYTADEEVKKARELFKKDYNVDFIGSQYLYDITIRNESNLKIKNIEIINKLARPVFVKKDSEIEQILINSGSNLKDLELNPGDSLNVNLISQNSYEFESQFLVLQDNSKITPSLDSGISATNPLVDLAVRFPFYIFIMIFLGFLFIMFFVIWILLSISQQKYPEFFGKNVLSENDYNLYKKIFAAYESKEKQKKLEQRNGESDK